LCFIYEESVKSGDNSFFGQARLKIFFFFQTSNEKIFLNYKDFFLGNLQSASRKIILIKKDCSPWKFAKEREICF